MTKEEAINKAIELEFGGGNAKNIRESNSSLIKVAEHLYDLMQPSLPSNLDEVAEDLSLKYSIKLEECGITASDSVHYRAGFKDGYELGFNARKEE